MTSVLRDIWRPNNMSVVADIYLIVYIEHARYFYLIPVRFGVDDDFLNMFLGYVACLPFFTTLC